MRKGSKRCCIDGCRLMATGAALHFPRWSDSRAYGSHACQHHLEVATTHWLKSRLGLNDLVLMAAKGLLR